MTDALLEVEHLEHTYAQGGDRRPALADVSFRIDRGEFVAIVGPSGSGKSTLLRCISGLMRPTSGTVRVAGHVVDDVPEELAIVFQDYGRSLFPWLTVRDNVAMPLRRLRLPSGDRAGRIDSSLDEVGLAEAASRYPWQLSGGMQQRVAIARAVAYQPQILLMDEPFGSVDAQTRADLQDMLLEVRQAHASTVVFVTHDIDESVYLADRVIILSQPPGRIVAEVSIELPRPREQIETRASRAFAELRAEVARLVRRPDR